MLDSWKDLLKRILFRNYMEELDFGSIYHPDNYEDAINTVKVYSNIRGVDQILTRLNDSYNAYTQEIQSIIDNNRGRETVLYKIWSTAEQNRLMSVYIAVISLVVRIVLGIIKGRYQTGYGLYGLIGIVSFVHFLCVLVILIGIIRAVIFWLKRKNAKKKYDNFISEIYSLVYGVESQYFSEIDMLVNKADDLYLNSLDPAHREAILMRREQKEFQEKMITLQRKKYNQEAEHQRKIEASQRKLLETQEELLRIEREREERRYRY